MHLLRDTDFKKFVIKFLLSFTIMYFGSYAIIGISAPGGYYSEFVANYLDYVSAIKLTLMHGSKFLLSFFGIETKFAGSDHIKFINGRGVFISYDCVGFGVFSFWIAFVIANKISIRKKIFWLFGGIFLLWIINVTRISLFLVAINKKWNMPLGIDHHTWFNIASYIAIFIMIYFFDRSSNHNLFNNKKTIRGKVE